jgi:hypothetical protein
MDPIGSALTSDELDVRCRLGCKMATVYVKRPDTPKGDANYQIIERTLSGMYCTLHDRGLYADEPINLDKVRT